MKIKMKVSNTDNTMQNKPMTKSSKTNQEESQCITKASYNKPMTESNHSMIKTPRNNKFTKETSRIIYKAQRASNKEEVSEDEKQSEDEESSSANEVSSDESLENSNHEKSL